MAIRIFIDQGHNPSGHNAGAEGNGLREQDVTYNVGIYLASLLNDDVRFQARVSRPTPETVLGIDNATSLQERVNMANSWPADYFISIHCNSNTNPEINGTEVYVYRANTQSYWLAQHILNGIVERVGTRDNGVRINPLAFCSPAHHYARRAGRTGVSQQLGRRPKAAGGSVGICLGNLSGSA